MNMLTWLGIGSLLGALTSAIFSVASARGVLLNIGAGSAGAWFGGWIVSSRMQLAVFPEDSFTLWGTLVMLGFTTLLLFGCNVILRTEGEAVRAQPVAGGTHLPRDTP